jgi:hypothetical protein
VTVVPYLRVDDVTREAEFFERVLGIRVATWPTGGPNERRWRRTSSAPPADLILIPGRGPTGAGDVLIVEVDDVRDVTERWGRPLWGPLDMAGSIEAMLLDPEGHHVLVVNRVGMLASRGTS